MHSQENFLEIPHALCKCSIQFSGESRYRKEKVLCYWIIIILYRLIKMKFYWLIVFFFVLEDKKLKKLAVVLKFLYFLTVLNLNSNLFYKCFLLVLFACKDPSLLYKSSKGTNPLTLENSETLFCFQHHKYLLILSLATTQK